MILKSGLLLPILLLSACDLFPTADKIEDGPLSQSSDADIFGFEKLPPLNNKGADALRVVIGPSFGRYHYRFDFVPLKVGCKIVDRDIDDMTKYDGNAYCGNVWANGVRIDREAEQSNVKFRFIVPAEDFKNLFDSVKFSVARWNGSWDMTTDGTSVAIELHNRGKISSLNSNGRSPDNPSALASLLVKAIALAYGPAGIFPKLHDWQVYTREDELDPKYACAAPQLSLSDIDGFGVGDDACAKSLRLGPTKN